MHSANSSKAKLIFECCLKKTKLFQEKQKISSTQPTIYSKTKEGVQTVPYRSTTIPKAKVGLKIVAHNSTNIGNTGAHGSKISKRTR